MVQKGNRFDIENAPKTYEEFLKSLKKPAKSEEPEGQLYVVSHEGCPSCAKLEEIYKEEIASGKIIFTTIDEDKGWDIIRTLEIMAVPTLVLERPDGSFCLFDKKGKISKCALPKKEEEDVG